MMKNGDREGWSFLSHSQKNNVFLSCSPINIAFYFLKRLQKVPEYAEMQHDKML